MKIDPRTLVLDVMERATLTDALNRHVRNLRAARAQLMGRDEKSRRAIDRNETETARAEDLIARLA